MIDDARRALLDQKKIQSEIEELQASSERKGTRMIAGSRVFSISENRGWWDQVLGEAGVENFRWHDLRHTTGSRLAQAGKSLKVVQQALGHKTIAMAARYSHIDQSSMQEEMKVLNSKTVEDQ